MNERQLIDSIAGLNRTGLAGPAGLAEGQLLKGIGDDCAVIRKDGNRVWLLTMDTLIESIHFNTAFHPPELLGRKAVSVNVSDIGAMGGRPLFVLLSVGLPPGYDQAWFQAFASGMGAACGEYGCLIIGGDTVASPGGLCFTLTVIGEAEADHVVYRSGARPGDTVWVSGELGLAAAGLALLSAGIEPDNPLFDPLRHKHLDPRARVQLGQRLAASGRVHAMMDLSDGLATDLAHLCQQSGLGAQLLAPDLPGLTRLAAAARLTGGDPERWAISGGEDFELLFTADPGDRDQLMQVAATCDLAITPVGVMVAGAGVSLIRPLADGGSEVEAIAFQGYDHFPDRTGG